MNARLAALGATLGRNKTPIGVAGAALVAVLALRARSSAAKTPTAATAPGVSTSPVSQSAGGYTASASGYDSTASDVYNAIQPQLEELRDLWSTMPSPIPVPEPATTSYGDGFYRPATETAVFKYADGKLDWLDLNEFKALGAPDYVDVSKDDPLWSAPTLGFNPRAV